MVRIHQWAPKKPSHRSRAPETIQNRAELQEWLDCIDPKIAAVEQALLVRQTTSLDDLCCDGNGTSQQR